MFLGKNIHLGPKLTKSVSSVRLLGMVRFGSGVKGSLLFYLAFINRAGGLSVWESLDRGRKYRPNAVRSVHPTEVKILPYRPPAPDLRRLSSVNKMFIIWKKQEQFNSFNVTGLY